MKKVYKNLDLNDAEAWLVTFQNGRHNRQQDYPWFAIIPKGIK
jgi:hypothetical protein